MSTAMGFNEYQEKALRTLNHLGVSRNILHCVMGVSGETAEVVTDIDAILKLEEHRTKIQSIEELNTPTLDEIYFSSRNSCRNELELEIGDCMWYVAVLYKQLGITLSAGNELTRQSGMFEHYPNIIHMVVSAGGLVDAIKKVEFYGKEMNSDEIEVTLGNYFYALKELCVEFRYDIHQVMERNIEKLTKRYPDKFDAELAQNHDGS